MTRTATLVLITILAGIRASLASPIGLWKAHDDATIEIKPCGQNLCGIVISTQPWSYDPKTGKPDYSDKYNVEGEKRHRSRVGIEVLIGMKRSGPSKWSGQLYNDRNGHTYQGDLIEVGPGRI